MKNNFFIVIEGIDNSGKTSLIQLIKQQLKLSANNLVSAYFGEKIFFTSEPYGAEQETKYVKLSNLIFSEELQFNSTAEAYLFLAMRADHISNFIIPKLQDNALIFCDRYYLSTLAYQAYLKQVDISVLDINMRYISQNIKPLVTFVLDVSAEQHQSFRQHNHLKCNKYDSINLFNYEQLSIAYEWAITHLKNSGEEVIVIPSSLSCADKAQLIISYIQGFIT